MTPDEARTALVEAIAHKLSGYTMWPVHESGADNYWRGLAERVLVVVESARGVRSWTVPHLWRNTASTP